MRIYDISPSDRSALNPAGRDAPVDPLTGDYLIPGGATSIEPPVAADNEIARWTGDGWELVPDWRGRVYYTDDGACHVITEIGAEPPVGAFDESPPEPLSDIAAEKRGAIETGRKISEERGVTISGIRYAGGPSNRQALREAVDLADTNGQTTFAAWKDSDGRFHVNHPVADVRQALLSIAERRGRLIAREGELNADIDAALDADDRAALEAVEWSEE